MGTFLRDLSMATKLISMCKARVNEWFGGSGSLGNMVEHEYEEAASKAVFRIVGMTCSACAGSVERAVKRLPGIHEAVIDALNNRAQILFYPSFVNVHKIDIFSSANVERAIAKVIVGFNVSSFTKPLPSRPITSANGGVAVMVLTAETSQPSK